jgi:ankyrin repeat protein
VVNNTDAFGVTLLHTASFKGHKKHTELLIANGANLNARQKYGNWTPLDIANHGKKTKVADLLRKHGGKTGEELKAEGK